MTKTISFRNRLCQICLEPYAPTSLHHIDDRFHDVCAECLAMIVRERESSGDLLRESSVPPVTPDAPPALLGSPRAEAVRSFRQFVAAMNFREVARTAARVGAYGALVLAVKPGNDFYPVLQGAVAADLATWVFLSWFSLPFLGLLFAIEFVIYTCALGIYWLSYESALQIPSDGEPLALALLSFFAVGSLKSFWWAMGIFLVDHE